MQIVQRKLVVRPKVEELKQEVKLPSVDTTADYENEQLILANAFNFSLKYDEFLLQSSPSDFIASNHKQLAWCLFELKKRKISITEDCECFKLVLNDCPFPDAQYEKLAIYTKEIRLAYTTESVNYSEHISKLKSDSAKAIIKREQISKLVKLCADPRTSPDQIRDALGEAQEIIEKGRLVETVFKDTKQLNKLYAEALQKRKDGIIVKTCYNSLDKLLTQGFAPGTLSIIAGRPGSGKSALVANFLLRLSTNEIRTALFSLEMNSVNMYDRIISIRTKIPTNKLIKEPGSLTELENKVLSNAMEEFESFPMLISDKATIGIEDLKRQLTLLDKMNKKPQVVFVDLFGKLKDVNVGQDLASKIEQKIQELYEFGKDYQCHFMAVVQIRRDDSATKKNYTKRPTLKGLKNSGAYEEAADLVMLIHRNKYYDTSLQDDILEISIAKQRMGTTGDAFFEFDAETCNIVSTDKVPVDYGDSTATE